MANLFTLQQIAGGFDPKRIAEENALAKILSQQRVNTNDAVLAGIQLDNKARTQKPTNKFETIQGKDGNRYQVEVAPNGQYVGKPTLIGGLGEAPRKPLSKAKEALVSFLPPELQVDPTQATDRDFIMAARARKEEAAQPSLAQQKFDAKQAESNQQKEKAEGVKNDVVRIATELRNHPGLERSVGTIQGSGLGQALTINEDSQDFINKFDQLKALLTSSNLDLMSGVLSETDIKILSDIAGGGLKLRGSEDAFRRELEKLGGVTEGPAEITTQADYDALPSGAVFIEDGVQYRKP